MCGSAERYMKVGFSLLAKPIQSKIILKTLFFVSTFTSHFLLPITRLCFCQYWFILHIILYILGYKQKKEFVFCGGFISGTKRKVDWKMCVHIVSQPQPRGPHARLPISWILFSFFVRLNWIELNYWHYLFERGCKHTKEQL